MGFTRSIFESGFVVASPIYQSVYFSLVSDGHVHFDSAVCGVFLKGFTACICPTTLVGLYQLRISKCNLEEGAPQIVSGNQGTLFFLASSVGS